MRGLVLGPLLLLLLLLETDGKSQAPVFVFFSRGAEMEKVSREALMLQAAASIRPAPLLQLSSSWDEYPSVCRSSSPSSSLIMEDCLIFLEPPKKDRSCLLTAPWPQDPLVRKFNGGLDNLEEIKRFMKIESESFLSDYSPRLKDRLYSLDKSDNKSDLPLKCAEVEMKDLDFDKFFLDFWLPQKPVVVRGVKDFSNLSIVEALMKHSHVIVGAKLSPSEEFEGVDSLLNWKMASEQHVPRLVLDQLQSPHKVVVRAAHADMTVDKVLSMLKDKHNRGFNANQVGNRTSCQWDNFACEVNDANVYVEYMPLDSSELSPLYNELLNISAGPIRGSFSGNGNISFSDFASSYRGFPEWVSKMKNGKPYLWLGDGKTIGKMHYDPYDNILLQIEGEKRFRLVDTSDNARLYEGHMREAQLDFERVARNMSSSKEYIFKFHKVKLSESTSMVHTPIENIASPDVTMFPKSSNIPYMDCVAKSGDMLFVPSFWWHEVISRSGPSRCGAPDLPSMACDEDKISLNVAINMWFEPLFQKEYPCAECEKVFNKNYAALLLDEDIIEKYV